MGWLHRLPYYTHQVVIEGFQVRLVLQLGGEGFQGLSSVILPTVEATVYKPLYAASQRREQCCYQEGGCHDCKGRLLPGERDEDPLQHYDAPEVECYQRGGERAVYQSAVYEDVYVVEAGLEDSEGHSRQDC